MGCENEYGQRRFVDVLCVSSKNECSRRRFDVFWSAHYTYYAIYSPSHRYCLTNGDNGIVRTLETPIYLTVVNENSLQCLDRCVHKPTTPYILTVVKTCYNSWIGVYTNQPLLLF